MIGRLGLRYRAWEKFGHNPEPDLRLITYLDTDEGTATDMLIAGYDRFLLADMAEAEESLPQIPGWIMSECRRRLWEVMWSAGIGHVIYVDTDSVVLDVPYAQQVMSIDNTRFERAWAVKGTYNSMTIHGPRNLVCETTRRVAGLPLIARQTAPLEFTGQIMRSIKESMKAGQLDCVATIPRKFVLDAPDLRRVHLKNGLTAPYEIDITQQQEDEA